MITKAHIEFARAAVALARQHGMGAVTVSFSLSVRHPDAGRDTYGRVQMAWTDGRHGVPSQITITSEETLRIGETLDEPA